MTDFMTLNDQALNLFNDITKTEAILDKVTNVVDGFEDNLAHISSEVKALQ